MLKQNGTRYSQYPLRFTGGAAAGLGSASRDTYQTCGKYRNQWCGQGGLDQRAGIPVGYRSGKAILLPLKDGGLGATNRLLGTGTATAGIAGGRNASVTLAGAGALLSAVTTRAHIMAALLGEGDLTAGIVGGLGGAATIAGSGALVGTASATALLDAVLAGVGGLISGLAGGLNAEADLTGSGTIDTATITALAELVALLTGTGEISSALLTVIVQASATLTGSGSVLATILGAGELSSSLVGTGALVSEISSLALIVAALVGSGLIASSNLAGGMNVASTMGGSSSLSPGLSALAQLGAEIAIGTTVTVDVGAIATAVLSELVAGHPTGSLGAVVAATQDATTNILSETTELLSRVTTTRMLILDSLVTTGADALRAKQALFNRLELADGSVNNWVLYADDNVTPLQVWHVTNKNGAAIVVPATSPARRVPT